jgi:hypothetical protein
MPTTTNSADNASTSQPITFQTTILKTGANTSGIPVPEEIVQKLGTNTRPLVRVTINQYTYRSAVAMMGGTFMISLSAENRQAAGVHAGEAVTIALELDLEPRTVDLPQDLKAALIKVDALKAFEQAAPSMQKEYVRQVEEAKTQETRDRRITKIVEKLAGA